MVIPQMANNASPKVIAARIATVETATQEEKRG